MHSEEYDRMYRLEDAYWWFIGRRRLAIGLLRKFLTPPSPFPDVRAGEEEGAGGEGISPSPRRGGSVSESELGRGDGSEGSSQIGDQDPGSPAMPVRGGTVGEGVSGPTILDLGCGTGVIATELSQWASTIGLDFSDKALAYCQSRGLHNLVQARGENLPLETASVDGVLALDIFEHIEDDVAAFRESFRVLRPGGILVLSVPAFKALWGPHDVALMHFRRYRRSEVVHRLESVGFKIERASYSVFFLFPIVVFIRILEKMKRGEAKASLPATPGWLNRALIGLQNAEAMIIAKMPLPWGSSVIAVARKPEAKS